MPAQLAIAAGAAAPRRAEAGRGGGGATRAPVGGWAPQQLPVTVEAGVKKRVDGVVGKEKTP